MMPRPVPLLYQTGPAPPHCQAEQRRSVNHASSAGPDLAGNSGRNKATAARQTGRRFLVILRRAA